MMLKSHKAVAYLIIALGVLHTSAAPFFFKSPVNGVWFAGAGLAAIFAGLLNLAQTKIPHQSGSIWLICLTGNIIFTVYAITLVAIVREPQTVLSLVLAAAATTAALLSRAASHAK